MFCKKNRQDIIPFRVARVFVTLNGDPVDGAAAMEVLFQLFCSGPIVHITHIYRPAVSF